MKRSPERSVATRLRALLLTLGLVLVGVVGVATPASATPPAGFGATQLGGASWLDGDGVTVYSNGSPSYVSGDYSSPAVGMKWQCVELAQRLYQARGWHSGTFPGVSVAADIFNVAAYPGNTNDFTRQGDGNITSVVPGDMLVFSGGGGPGHVGIISTITNNSNGTKSLGVINQNAYEVASNVIWNTSAKTVGKYWYMDGQSTETTFSVLGIVHSTNNTAVNNGDGQITWKLRNHKSAGTPDASFYYGADTSAPVVGDWDANGSESIGVVRDNGAGNLFWQLRYSNTEGVPSVTATYGASTDMPIVGNWDGVGTTTVGIVRDDGSGQLMWKLSNNNSTTATTFYYGASTDTPVVGDWDGNGTTTIGIVRKDTASGQLLWKLRNSNSAGTADVSFYYGGITAKPIPGDWDGNGTVTAGVVRNDDGSGQLYWQLRDSNSAGTPGAEFYYGASTDTPVAGSWGGAGAMNVGIARN